MVNKCELNKCHNIVFVKKAGHLTICITMAFFSASFSLESKKEKAIALLPPSHCLPLEEREVFSTLEKSQIRLQDYAFTQGFALVQKSFQK